MANNPPTDLRRFSAEKPRTPSAPAGRPSTSARTPQSAPLSPSAPPASGRGSGAEVSNADVLSALLALSEGVRSIIAETLATELGDIRRTLSHADRVEATAPPAPVAAPPPDVIRAAVAEAVAAQLADIRQAATPVVDIESASFNGLRQELSDIMAHIDRTKAEIAALRPEDAKDDQIVVATSELDAVVEATETATSEILEQSEKIQEIVQKLRDDCSANRQDMIVDHIDELEAISTQLLISCSFQDITGQRINKVVNTLLYIEQHISAMMTIWQIERGTGQAHLMVNAPDDDRPDKDLLQGPQLDGRGVTQDDIDALFG